MRAKMSDRDARDTAFPGLPSDALAEARAILARSEPVRDAEGWLTAHVPSDFPEWGMDALAESLRAFIDAPIPEQI